MSKGKKILLISSGQPSLNPRLVKEADALTDEGYLVTVIYQYWNDWGTEHDKQLLSSRKWKAVRVGGTPSYGALSFNISRVIHKISRSLSRKSSSFLLPEIASTRSSLLFYFEAKKHPCDLIIAHNLAALPFARMAANYHKVPLGFDAEDFHRFENSDNKQDEDVKLKTFLEEKYFPGLNYLTTASYLITEEYKKLFPELVRVCTILNVFPKQTITRVEKTEYPLKKLRLFWFSQTIGLDRGLENIIEAAGNCLNRADIELHLLGNYTEETRNVFSELATQAGLQSSSIYFYKPIPADEIMDFAARFDIGLATETGSPYNRDICLTNKIFTYLQSGLAILASDTSAQKHLLRNIPGIGAIYNRREHRVLSVLLDTYFNHPEALAGQKKNALDAALIYNWDNEKEKFFSVINSVLEDN